MIAGGFMLIAVGFLFCAFLAAVEATEIDNFDDCVLRVLAAGVLLFGACVSAAMSGAAFIVGLVT